MKVGFMAIFVGVLASCNVLAPAPTATPTATPTAFPTATKTATIFPTETPIPQIETPASPALPLPSGTPAADWEGIPVMPNALAGNGDATGYAFTIKTSTDEIQSFYQAKMAKIGWNLLANGQGTTGAVLMIFTKGSDTATISIIPQTDDVIYVMLVK